MSIAVEIAVQDARGLDVAAHGGADRVELCIDLDRGGVTPPADLVERCAARAKELVTAQEAKPHFGVHVLVRSRAGEGDFRTAPGEFVYAPDEVDLMAEQAADVVAAGADGVVIGALTPTGELDLPTIEGIRDRALHAASDALRGVTLTAHRAVDAMEDDAREATVRTLLGLGFHRVLSSGGAAAAPEGTASLARMVRAGEGLIDVCAGGGIRPVHIPDLVRATGVADLHLSARRGGHVDPPASAQPGRATDPAVVQAAVDAAGAL